MRQRGEALLFQACHLPDLTGRMCQHPHLTDEETGPERQPDKVTQLSEGSSWDPNPGLSDSKACTL